MLRPFRLRERRSRRSGFVLLPILVLAGCVSGASRLEIRALTSTNPTYYEFDLPLESLRAQVIAALSLERQFENPIFPQQGSTTVLHVTEAGEGPTWATALRLPGNEQDLYLEASHSPLWESPVYRGDRGGMPFLAEFHVHFVGVSSNRTGVSVTALQTEVINGSTFGLGSCGPGRFNRYVRVEPTSVEEYMILRFVGEILGVRSMPEVILPAP